MGAPLPPFRCGACGAAAVSLTCAHCGPDLYAYEVGGGGVQIDAPQGSIVVGPSRLRAGTAELRDWSSEAARLGAMDILTAYILGRLYR